MSKNETISVLITGGSGFIGSHLTEKLLSLNKFQITIIDNNFSEDVLPEEIRNQIIYETIDIRDFNSLERIFQEKKPVYCFHLAAIHFIPYCIEHPNDVIDVNIKGTSNIQHLCKKYSCNLIQASSAAVYNPDDTPHVENSKTEPIDIYGYSKKVNEDTLNFFFDPKDDNLFGVNARFFNVYGTRDSHPHVISEIIKQIKTQFNKEIITLELGNIEPKRDFIHTSDVVDAMIEVADKITNGIHTFNMGSGNSLSIRELIGKIEKIIGKKIDVEISEKRFRKSDRMNLQSDNSRITEIIGWEPKMSIDVGLEMLLKEELSL